MQSNPEFSSCLCSDLKFLEQKAMMKTQAKWNVRLKLGVTTNRWVGHFDLERIWSPIATTHCARFS